MQKSIVSFCVPSYLWVRYILEVNQSRIKISSFAEFNWAFFDYCRKILVSSLQSQMNKLHILRKVVTGLPQDWFFQAYFFLPSEFNNMICNWSNFLRILLVFISL